jgi:hypothetical protein
MMRLFREDPNEEPERLHDLASVDVVLRCGSFALEMQKAIRWQITRDPDFLVGMAWELTDHLRLAMDLYAAADAACADYDPSVYEQQSLLDDSTHAIHSWTMLIGLLREAFERAESASPQLARALIEYWLRIPYPIFRRLALFGISRLQQLHGEHSIHLLLAEPESLLWPYYLREFATRIVAVGCKVLSPDEFIDVITRLLSGPPRSMFVADISGDDYKQVVDSATVAFLSAIEREGTSLPEAAQTALREARGRWGDNQPSVPDSEGELSIGGATGRPFDPSREFENFSEQAVFDTAIELRAAGKAYSAQVEVWASKNPMPGFALLEKCIRAEIWDEQLWHALWSGIANSGAEPPTMPDLLASVPPGILSFVAPKIAGWLGQMSHERTKLGPEFLGLWDLVCPFVSPGMQYENKNPLVVALNSPAGQLCKAILNAYLATSPGTNSGLPSAVKTRVELLLASDLPHHGGPVQLIAALNLHSLHLVDREWTREFVLPAFEWRNPLAASVWRCYLHNCHWYPDLIADLRPALMDALSQHKELGEAGRHLCGLLANVAVSSPASLSDRDLSEALRRLERIGLCEVCEALGQIVRNVNASRTVEVWNRGIKRVLQLLPLEKEKRSPDLADRLVDFTIAAGPVFEEASELILFFLMPISGNDFGSVMYRIAKTDLPERFPASVVKILAEIICPGGTTPFMTPDAARLLQRARAASPQVIQQPAYRRLASSGWFELA